jgi:hypothetical protein
VTAGEPERTHASRASPSAPPGGGAALNGDLQADGDSLADGGAHGPALVLNILIIVCLLRPGVVAALRRRT